MCEESERTGINNDNETDELYSRYWHLIHDNFDLELLKKTERRAGHGSFMEPEYIDTLIEVIKEQPKKICTYRGYELIRGIDCWGNISYAPYKNADSSPHPLSLVLKIQTCGYPHLSGIPCPE